MFAQTFRFDPGLNQLIPALPDPSNLTAPCNFGASLTIPSGASIARKTSDGKFYLFNKDATDGTQAWCGFNMIYGATDSSGLFYPITNGTAGISYYATGIECGTYYPSGVFDPATVTTAATGTPVAEVDTATPTGTVTAGDTWGIYNAAGVGVEVIANATATVAAIITQMKNAWNDDVATAALATATGSATVLTLTAVNAGVALGLTSTATAASSFLPVFAVATAAVAAQQAEVDTWTLTTAPSTADTFTLTYTQPNAQTIAVVATVGATATIAATTPLIAAAWNANATLANLATATSTGTTVVLTGVNTGNVLNTAMTTSSASTTLGKVVTKPSLGRSFTDLPRGYILQPYGFWKV